MARAHQGGQAGINFAYLALQRRAVAPSLAPSATRLRARMRAAISALAEIALRDAHRVDRDLRRVADAVILGARPRSCSRGSSPRAD